MTDHYIYAVLGVVLDLSIDFGQGPKKNLAVHLLSFAFFFPFYIWPLSLSYFSFLSIQYIYLGTYRPFYFYFLTHNG